MRIFSNFLLIYLLQHLMVLYLFFFRTLLYYYYYFRIYPFYKIKNNLVQTYYTSLEFSSLSLSISFSSLIWKYVTNSSFLGSIRSWKKSTPSFLLVYSLSLTSDRMSPIISFISLVTSIPVAVSLSKINL